MQWCALWYNLEWNDLHFSVRHFVNILTVWSQPSLAVTTLFNSILPFFILLELSANILSNYEYFGSVRDGVNFPHSSSHSAVHWQLERCWWRTRFLATAEQLWQSISAVCPTFPPITSRLRVNKILGGDMTLYPNAWLLLVDIRSHGKKCDD